MTHPPVIVSKRGESRVRSGHPWIFKSDVARAKGIPPGSVVRVVGSTGRPLGFAFFSAEKADATARVRASETARADDFMAERDWKKRSGARLPRRSAGEPPERPNNPRRYLLI